VRAAGLVALLLAACGDNIKPHRPGDDELAPTLPAIEQGIFATSCMFGACHGGNAPAAGLDLTPGRSCQALREAPSCLFSDQTLVVPGDPDASFLLGKVEGNLPGWEPDGPCRIRTNEPMPYNARPLAPERVAQIREWIASGASCDGDSSEGPDGPTAQGAAVVAVTAAAPYLRVGQSLQVVVLLADPAPEGGQTLEVETSDGAIQAPSQVAVGAGATSVELEVRGLRSSRALEIRVRGGGAEAKTRVQVLGLLFSEIFFDAAGGDDGMEWIQLRNVGLEPIDLSGYSVGAGRTAYDYTRVTLSGLLAPGACALVGGPGAIGPGGPTQDFEQVYNFDPDLPNGSNPDGEGTAFGLFAGQVAEHGIPIDAVLCGSGNGGGLQGPDGLPLAPTCPDVNAGQSVVRRDIGFWDAATPDPSACEDLL
jgi:hypothetical protein